LEKGKVNVATTAVCAEEIQRGWLARISQARRPDDEVLGYTQFTESIHFLATLTLLPWDLEAAARFRAFRQSGIRIGSMDLKIACIALEYNVTLLTRNVSILQRYRSFASRIGSIDYRVLPVHSELASFVPIAGLAMKRIFNERPCPLHFPHSLCLTLHHLLEFAIS
jgi:predicted nucleic acid-binding protein